MKITAMDSVVSSERTPADKVSRHRSSLLAMLALLLAGPLVAQSVEPEYRVSFIPEAEESQGEALSGQLAIAVLPPPRESSEQDSGEPVPVILHAAATLYQGNWLAEAQEENLRDAEAFVQAKFNLFRTATEPSQFRPWLDAETFAVFAESVARGEIDLAADREIYLQYDDIRLLGAVHYGHYTLLYTQFRALTDAGLVTSVMPVRRIDGRFLSAGAMHMNSHELYRMLALGTLQRLIVDYLESRVNN